MSTYIDTFGEDLDQAPAASKGDPFSAKFTFTDGDSRLVKFRASEPYEALSVALRKRNVFDADTAMSGAPAVVSVHLRTGWSMFTGPWHDISAE